MLAAFDQLFDKAADKLRLDLDENAKAEAKKSFARRFEGALRIADRFRFPSIPAPVIEEMEAAIEDLSPAELAGYIAAGPLTMKLEEIMRALAMQAAEERLIDHVLRQADDAYGGN